MTSTQDYDIILLSQFRWDGLYSSISIAMAKELAKSNRVFYLNHPKTWRDLGLIKGWQQQQTNFTQIDGYEGRLVSIDPPAVVPINFLPPSPLYRSLAAYNTSLVEKAIQQTLQRFNIEQYLFLNCFDPFYPVGPQVTPRPALNIYQCVDDIAASEYLSKHGPRLETEAIRQADICLVTSSELKKLKGPFNKNTHLLHNAADVSLFCQARERSFPLPPELAGTTRKVIGYIGNLDQQRIDYSLLIEVANNHADKILLLVGPVNNTIAKRIGLTDQPNVIFTGGKKIEDLLPYLHHMDCALIPFNCNALTRSIYPLKINEYLAAGKPVVATPFSEDIATFKNHIYLADTSAKFIQAISMAIETDRPERQRERSQFAAQNSWSNRIQQFWEIVDSVQTTVC